MILGPTTDKPVCTPKYPWNGHLENVHHPDAEYIDASDVYIIYGCPHCKFQFYRAKDSDCIMTVIFTNNTIGEMIKNG